MNVALSDLVTGDDYGVFPTVSDALAEAERIGVYAVLTGPTDAPLTREAETEDVVDMASARRERQRANRERGHKPFSMDDYVDAPRPERPSLWARLSAAGDRWARFTLRRFG